MSNVSETVTELVGKTFTTKDGRETTLQSELQTSAGLSAGDAKKTINQFVATTTAKLQDDPSLASNPKKLAQSVVEEMAKNDDLKNTLVAGVRTTSSAAKWLPEGVLVPKIKDTLTEKMTSFFEKNQPRISAAAQQDQTTRQASIGFMDPSIPSGLPNTPGALAAKGSDGASRNS